MSEERVLLVALRREGGQWIADVSFRAKRHTITFDSDDKDQLREVTPTPFTLTREGHEICELVKRVRGGEALSLPHAVEPPAHGPRLPSVHRPFWRDHVGPLDIWLDAVKHIGDARLVAALRIEGEPDVYDIEVLPGPEMRVLDSPRSPVFHAYTYDLQCMLLRIHRGERFSLPFKLRPRWPTPAEPPALPPDA